MCIFDISTWFPILLAAVVGLGNNNLHFQKKGGGLGLCANEIGTNRGWGSTFNNLSYNSSTPACHVRNTHTGSR